MKLFIFSKSMELNIQNETSRLRAVILGIAKSNGPRLKVAQETVAFNCFYTIMYSQYAAGCCSPE